MISYVWTAVITALFLAHQSMQNPHQGRTHTRVAVYRGPGTIDGTPESAAELFTSAWKDSRVTYVGPKEHVKITRAALGEFDVYIQPGGGDLDPAWKTMKEFNDTIRDFVSNGGHYLGFCLGAYLAGQGPGFDLFPPGVDTDQEIAQVRNHDESDTVIQVDWTFSTGEKRGRTEKNRWLYFQDGAAILGSLGRPGDRGKVLGRYSKSGDAAAYVVRYGDGVVGVVGPHPEATKDWYDEYGIKNPTGYDLDIGRDFIRAVMEYKGCD